MKCKKCGADIPEGSKFCNECGAKIEQVALSKGSEPKSTESYKCEKCGKIIPNNSVFCPECHAYQSNNFKSDNKINDISKSITENKSVTVPEKSSNKKPIYRTSHFYVALLITLILCVTAVIAISQVSQPESLQAETTVEPTIEDSYYSDFEEETTEYLSKTSEYSMGKVNYEIPSKWSTAGSDATHHYHYNIFNELFFVGCSKLDSDYVTLDNTLIDALIESDKNSYDDYKQLSKKITSIDGYRTLHSIFTYKKDKNNEYCNSYVFIVDNYLYMVAFNSSGTKQSSNFDLYEDEIIDSITIDNYEYDYEEEKTKKSTEPPTEKPTEFEDTLTELYSDSEIAVYYSDTEKYPYSDDEANVHFYIKNKMDKKIEIQADTVILDGRSYNKVICSDPISAHSEGMIEITVENCKNFSPSTVGADLRYFDSDTYGNDVKMNLISKKVK